jgi:O-antigen ligase
LLGGLAGIAAVVVAPGAIIYRLSSGFGFGANAVSAGRLDDIWLPLLPEILRSPLYGNGLSSILWSEAMQAQAILAVTHPHNAYLALLLDMGALGVVAMALFYGSVWRGLRKAARNSSLPPEQQGFFEGAAAGLLAFLLAGFAGSSLTPVPEQSFLWLAIGAMYGLAARTHAANKVSEQTGFFTPGGAPVLQPQRGLPA